MIKILSLENGRKSYNLSSCNQVTFRNDFDLKLSIIPNPAIEDVKLYSNKDIENIIVEISTIHGKKINTLNIDKIFANSGVSLLAQNWLAGRYIVKVYDQNDVFPILTEKIVKIN